MINLQLLRCVNIFNYNFQEERIKSIINQCLFRKFDIFLIQKRSRI